MAALNDLDDSVNGWNPDYVESLYEQYRKDPGSLDEKWQAFFQGFELARGRGANGAAPATAPGAQSDRHARISEVFSGDESEWAEAQLRLENLQSRVDSLIYHYRDVGHLIAKLDPLGRNREMHHLLELDAFHLNEDMLDMVFNADHFPWGGGTLTLREIIDALQTAYCGSIGVEYMDIQNTPERRWLQKRMEPTLNQWEIPVADKIRALRLLRKAVAFEKFLHTNYIGQKRFSLEGAETLIPLLDTIIENCPAQGIEQVVMGMAHRGRLNVLANILHKSYEEIFSEFEDNWQPGDIMGDGDVKYHKGYSTDWITSSGDSIHLSLTANPSHLEAVDPVVLGRCRAKQRNIGDTDRNRVIPILIHGDAAFAGQGIVAETLNLSQLRGYRVGGTIHVIVNNQIGFTTLPEDARSGDYCTDVAKMIQAPIFHVNGDDPEAVLRVSQMALEFRQKFAKDVVIDMYCYRRHGHNEGDEPSFTQPQLYELIRNHPTVLEIYTNKLIKDGVVSTEQVDEIAVKQDRELEEAQQKALKEPVKPQIQPFQEEWSDIERDYSHKDVKTAVPKKTLLEISRAWTRWPEGFEPNRKIAKLMEKRVKAVEKGKDIDWGTAEGLALGSLLAEGIPVRLSGQDSRRGTFSHRHAFIWDAKTAEKYMPLQHIHEDQARFCAYDSALSEASVLGFDYGYSLEHPDMLICWEAQFGDFVNGAQVIIDQFIVSSETKWNRVSGLVLLLPHGYEGQGPEHSSAWLERFLALCAEDNIQVCNLTTPAQIFHVLRRQMHRRFRKPLIIMTPKSLLRHPKAVSTLSDMTSSHFHEIIDDEQLSPEKVRRLVLCSGKVYYDLLAKREETGVQDVAIARVEQFYPLPLSDMKRILNHWAVDDVVWCQEEPKNRGGWMFMRQLFRDTLDMELNYIGRDASASPAVGSLSRHRREQDELVSLAITGKPSRSKAPMVAVVGK